ncbi:DegT/DnrJ/EryC1/StrS family aminotransferase, partial [Candidatus Parcubacteria bacterium]
MKQIGMAEIKLTDAEIEAAVRVLHSGALRQGKQCEAFEREFAEKVGAKHAVTCANGSAALHLAYMALLDLGDEVLVPSFTFIATGNMVNAMGGRPIICDVDRETFLIDLKDAENRITERTKAIAPVHLFGNPCDVNAVRAFAEKHGLKVIWDAAQAHGTRFKGKDIGGLDDAVTYSFYPSKNMFVGEGGMICTNDDDVAYKLRFLRTHGQTGKYYHTMLGYNYRMTDVEAAIGREQLKRLDAMLEVRRRNARMLNEGVAQIPGITPQRIMEGGESSWHQYCVVVEPEAFGMNRDELAARLREKGIMTGIHYPRGMHQQPIFEELYGKQELP